jgi:uncharacterized membrane protein
MSEPAPAALAERLGGLDALDQPAGPIGRFWRSILTGKTKALLSGAPLGHALHPILTDVPIGTWTSATLLDLIGGRDGERAARLLIGAGLAAALPTFWSGWSDWSDEEERDPDIRRIGLVHATVNGTAAALYGASLLARRRGDRGRGKLLGLAGAGVLGAGGFLGGHLSSVEGSRVRGR